MSKISLEPNDSGAGTFSIVSPDSNTNRTLNLPDESGILFSDGSGVPGSAVTGQLASSNMPAGSVIQVVQTFITNPIVVTNTSYQDLPNFELSITPNSQNSKMIIMVNFGGITGGDDGNNTTTLRFTRNGNVLTTGDTVGDRSSHNTRVLGNNYSSVNHSDSSFMCDIDFPATLNTVTYKVQNQNENGTLYVNRAQSYNDASTNWNGTSASVFYIMEVLG